MATSGSKKINVVSSGNIYLLFSWTAGTPSIANNYTPIDWNLKEVSVSGSGANISSSAAKDCLIKIEGDTVFDKTVTVGISAGATRTLASGTKNIYHNTDGSKTFSFSFSQEFNITYSGKKVETITGSGTGTLETIPRAANIITAPDFTDEDNPTLTYNNPAGNAVDSLQACISFDGTAADISYRDINKTGNTYTFELTDAERNILRNGTTTSNSRTVKFYIKTVINEVTYSSILTKTLTIINAQPTLTPSVEDGNATTIALTGDSNKLIKYYSNASATASYSGLKGATTKDYKVTNNKKTLSTIPAIFNAVESAVFDFSISDTRGNTTKKTVTKTLINYVKLTCNLTANNPTTDGKMAFNISGNCFNGSFGAVSNTLTVQYRYKENDGSYSSWITATATKTNNTYSADIELTGLDYRSAYTFQARAVDKLATVATAEKRVKAIPVFEWGENDYKFNVPVYDENGKPLTPIEFEHGDTYGHVHFGNGLLIQWGRASITPTAANTVTSANILFPLKYDDVPKVEATPNSNVPHVITSSIGGGTTTEASKEGMVIYLTRTNTVATVFQWLAVGFKAVD